MNEEIRLRSPSGRGGRSPRGSMRGLGARVKRPSVGDILSQVPYIQQHLSEANLVTVGIVFFISQMQASFSQENFTKFT